MLTNKKGGGGDNISGVAETKGDNELTTKVVTHLLIAAATIFICSVFVAFLLLLKFYCRGRGLSTAHDLEAQQGKPEYG